MNNVTRSIRYWLAPLGLAFFVSACSDAPEAHLAAGEVGELQFQVAYLPVSPNQTEVRTAERIGSLVGHLEKQLSTTYAGSEVARINNWHSTEAMVLTRELEDFVRASLEANEVTAGDLALFSVAAGQAATEPLNALLLVDNHQLRKTEPSLQLEFDSLLSGFVVDRVAILMGQMGIEQYRITINGQSRTRGHHRLEMLKPTMLGSEPTGAKPRNFALGYAITPNGSQVFVLNKTTILASALAQWLAMMEPQQALIVAEQLDLPIVINQHVNGAVKRYNSSAFP
ncbi:FAD:protein FMN transferase [Aliidiomarina quisquiliarum]|uniref:FAD:protein FMN transferase n=1 Tax=Aliidiomarina quisquiliarum TaxID=2938947 RepID=UPI00208E1B24|nr:FAD:protein FMN transferase [Aliidiomarina quisquiliarum]